MIRAPRRCERPSGHPRPQGASSRRKPWAAQFNLAGSRPKEISGPVEFYQGELPRLGVEVRLARGSRRRSGPGSDLYVTATGSEPSRPPLPGVERPQVMTAHQVLAGERVVAEGPAVVLGGGATGLETAEFLAERGLTVAVVDMLDLVGRDMVPGLGVREYLLARLAERGARLFSGHRAVRITETAVEISPRPLLGGGAVVELPARAVVLAMGLRPRPPLADLESALGGEWHYLGDCCQPGNGMAAIHAAFAWAIRV